MHCFYDNIFGTGYETRVLSNRSPQSLFMVLLIYVFLLGMLLDGAFVRASDRWFFALMAIAVFLDARVIYRLLGRATQHEAPSLSIAGNTN